MTLDSLLYRYASVADGLDADVHLLAAEARPGPKLSNFIFCLFIYIYIFFFTLYIYIYIVYIIYIYIYIYILIDCRYNIYCT